MTVDELTELFIDDSQKVAIYDCASNVNNVVYQGTVLEIPPEYQYKDVESIDNLDKSDVFTINISTED